MVLSGEGVSGNADANYHNSKSENSAGNEITDCILISKEDM